MIFVTVSLDLHPFHRLIRKMDEIAGQLDEEVIIQGGIDYEAKNAKYLKWIPRNKMQEPVVQARLVVTHAGIGAILLAMQHRKPLIIVPRMKKYKEHHNDHQLQVARQIQGRRGIKVVYDVDNLRDMLDFSEEPNFDSVGKDRLTGAIKQFVDRLARLQVRKNG